MGSFQNFLLYICPPPGIISASHVAFMGSGLFIVMPLVTSPLAEMLSGDIREGLKSMFLYALSNIAESGREYLPEISIGPPAFMVMFSCAVARSAEKAIANILIACNLYVR